MLLVTAILIVFGTLRPNSSNISSAVVPRVRTSRAMANVLGKLIVGAELTKIDAGRCVIAALSSCLQDHMIRVADAAKRSSLVSLVRVGSVEIVK